MNETRLHTGSQVGYTAGDTMRGGGKLSSTHDTETNSYKIKQEV